MSALTCEYICVHKTVAGPEPVTETAVVEHHQMATKKEIRIVSSMSDILDRADVSKPILQGQSLVTIVAVRYGMAVHSVNFY